MLSDRYCQLLTSYVDGELSTRQRKAVRRLLRKSAEAREMLRQLQEDARVLRGIPPVKLEEDISPHVVRTITERRQYMARRAALARNPGFPNLAGYVAAASVVLVISFSTYLYFHIANDDARPDADRVAEKNGKGSAADKGTDPKATPVNDNATAPVVVETPSPDPTEVVANPNPILDKFEVMQLKLALQFDLKDLDQEKTRVQLRQQLQPDDSYRVELASAGRGKALARLETACNAQGVRLMIDQEARNRMANPRWSTDYVIYLEDVTHEEAADILDQLAVDEKKDNQFRGVVVLPLTEGDHKELSRLLGVDPIKLDPPNRPHGVDIRKPVSAITAEQLKTVPPGPDPNKPAAGKPLTKKAIVVAYNPVTQKPSSSKEIKSFLDSRVPKRSGTIQILLILRGANG